MTIFKSSQPPIQGPYPLSKDFNTPDISHFLRNDGSLPFLTVPSDITLYDFIFDSPSSPLHPSRSIPQNEQAAFTDAVTKARVPWPLVKDYATSISTALVKHYDFRPGDTINMFSRNTIWYPITMFGALRVGGIVSGASPAYNEEEMVYALQKAGAKYLATSEDSIQIASRAAERVGIPHERIFLLEGNVQGYTTVNDLISLGSKLEPVASFKLPAGKTNRDVCAYLSFSSGTTGLPKAVQIAHGNVIAQIMQVLQITPSTRRKILGVLPLFHITGLVHVMNLGPILNAEVIMMPQYSMAGMLSTVQEYQVEELLLVPPIIIRLVRDDMTNDYDLSCVKRVSSGAAPLSDEIIQLLAKKFPNAGFKQGYGMTESCSCITAHPPHMYDLKYAHTVGTIVAGTEVKILKEDGSLGKVGEPGEVLARGPQVVMGYLNNEKATADTFDKDGFLHTGDQGMIDEEGVLTILDRIKELIKVNGIGVAPAELEDLLLGHGKVEDVAVMSVPDDLAGETPKAYVVLKDGVTRNIQEQEDVGRELIRYVRERKVRHKWVKEVELVSDIPKSASGKILRRVLRDQAKAGRRGVYVRDEKLLRAKL